MGSALLLLGVGSLLLAWTWGSLPDLLVDYGREVYVPWRLSMGERLHADLAYFNGPLSPYFNSLIFRLFSPGVLALTLANVGLLAVTTTVLFRLLKASSGEGPARWACLLFLTVFAFQVFQPGPFNYLAPYSHEMTHGLLVCLLGLASVEAFRKVGGYRWVLTAGGAAGLAFLTKPEIALAAIAIPWGIWMSARERGATGPGALRYALVCLLGWAAMVGVGYAALAWSLSPPTALRGIMAPWIMAADTEVTSLPFYRASLGLDDLGGNLGSAAAWGGAYALLLGLGFALDWVVRRPNRPLSKAAWKVSMFCLSFVLSLSLWALGGLERAARPLPFLILAFLILEATGSGLLGELPGKGRRRTLRVLLLAFSLLLMLKILFASRVIGYGFVLAMPATMMVAVALLSWIPSKLRERGRWGALFRTWSLGFVLAFAAAHLLVARERLREKRYEIVAGSEVVRTDPVRGAAVERALEVTSRILQGGGGLAVIPEGALLNYLLGSPNPTPYFNLMPPEMVHFGEGQVLEAYAATPPKVILLVHKDLGYYGVGPFGSGYSRALLEWVRGNYRLVERVGEPPFLEDTTFGIDVLELRARP